MPLSPATTSTTADPDNVQTHPLTAEAAVNDGYESTAEGRAEAAEAGGAVEAVPSESAEGGLGSLEISVLASATVRGFALATWRGAANRDGFVMDIDG